MSFTRVEVNNKQVKKKVFIETNQQKKNVSVSKYVCSSEDRKHAD